MTYREVTEKLRALGCVELPRQGDGSHRKWFNSKNKRATTVPDWGAKDLKTGTLRAVVKQLGLEWEKFVKA